MYYKYFTCGSESEMEGLTLAKFCYYDDGTLAIGSPNGVKSLYKGKEITEEEYEELSNKLESGNYKKGFAGGLVNEEGLRKIAERFAKEKEDYKVLCEPKIALSVKKIRKLLELGIIEQSDIDIEIEQQNMSDFSDEIKKRLNQ